MARTRRRATTRCSSTAQESRPVIQILQDQTISILELVSPKGNDTILNATTDTRTTSAMNTLDLPPTPPCIEDVPAPRPFHRP
jgi:hypothetical protein